MPAIEEGFAKANLSSRGKETVDVVYLAKVYGKGWPRKG